MNRYEPFKRAVIRHRNYLTKGMAEIYAFRAIVMFVTASGVFLKYLVKVELPVSAYVVSGLLMAAGCWVLGYYWDKSHMYHYENEFSNERNDAIQKLLGLK